MEFHQKPDAESGAQSHHVAPGDTTTEAASSATLRERMKDAHVQPSVRAALGALDSLLTQCHQKGDLRSFRDGLRTEDVAATRAALEIIRRQTFVVARALTHAEEEQRAWLRSELHRMLIEEEGRAE